MTIKELRGNKETKKNLERKCYADFLCLRPIILINLIKHAAKLLKYAKNRSNILFVKFTPVSYKHLRQYHPPPFASVLVKCSLKQVE